MHAGGVFGNAGGCDNSALVQLVIDRDHGCEAGDDDKCDHTDLLSSAAEDGDRCGIQQIDEELVSSSESGKPGRGSLL